MERDDILKRGLDLHIYFNSHAHVERDPATNSHNLSPYDFNSHAHVERDAVYLYDE